VAGLCAAEGLAAAGARVMCLEAERLGAGASGRNGGQLLLGVVEAPHRVLASLGEHRTRELFELTRASVAWLEGRGVLERAGLASVALDSREPVELERTHAALEALGIPCTLHPAAESAARFGLDGAGASLDVGVAGRVRPGPAITRLAEAARAAGAELVESAPVTGIEQVPDGIVVVAGDRRIQTEVVVWAAGIGTRELEPALEDLLVPVREQARAIGGLSGPADGARAGYGYTWFERDGDEGWVGGCRWATPHLEVGERESVVVPRVQERIEGFAQRLAWTGEVVRQWAWIEAHTRDGLPLVGPVPGANRLVACVGFCGNDWGLGPGAAALVTEGLMGERAEASALFAPSRFT